MKKNYKFYLLLVAVPFISLVLLSLSGGRDGQYSGSPADGGQTCTACHSGGSFSAEADITTTIPGTGFVYGETYQITVSVASGATKHGFQLTAEDASDTQVGTYTAGSGTQIVNSGTHITHTASGNTQNSWTFDWTAPTTAEGGEITFYTAVIAANANNGTSGDEVVTASATFSHSSIGIDEIESISLRIYPNPSSDFIRVDSNNKIHDDLSVTFFNSIGQAVLKTNTADRINVQSLDAGVYFLELKTANKVGISRFVKK